MNNGDLIPTNYHEMPEQLDLVLCRENIPAMSYSIRQQKQVQCGS